MDWIIEQTGLCTECQACVDVCPTYKLTGKDLFSPVQRLKTAVKVFEEEIVTEEMLESIYNCPKCMCCENICPEKINITKIVHKTRCELVRRGLAPSEKHNKVINGILASGNSVNGDPLKRLEWLPEEFPKHTSDTLLYLGCLPSYLVKDAASATYLVLKKLGLNFMILEDEGCCGTYLYESGRIDLAGDFFQKNVERFASLGIRRIIVPCNGCLKCFKYFYPDLLGGTGFSVCHVTEIIYDLLKQNSGALKKVQGKITYQDSCRLARGRDGQGGIEEPRQILRLCGAEIVEMEKNGKDAVCCGAGGDIRSVYPDLSLNIATKLLNTIKTESIASACPFCVFNLGYTSRKKKLGKNISYFTKIVLDALQ